MAQYTIAIIDEEENQRNQFEFVFDQTFNVVKIDTLESVDALIAQIKSECIDAIAIDYRLNEHGSSFTETGDFFFKEIRNQLYEFPVFILTRSSEEVKKICKTVDPSFIMDKENINYNQHEVEKKDAFLDFISTKIMVYKNDLRDKMDRLTDLEEIRKNNSDAFLAVENEYINLNFLLSKYISGSNIPITYFTKDSNDKLDALISKTEDMLKKLEG